MTVSLADFIQRIRRRVNDPSGTKELYSDAFIMDAIDEGLRALADYGGQIKSHTWTPTTDTSVFQLPPDFLRLVNVPPLRSSSSGGTTLLGEDVYLGTHRPLAGETYYAPDDTGAPEGYALTDTTIVVYDGVDAGVPFIIVYEARWPGVDESLDELDLPHWAETALGYYANYYLLQLQGNKYARDGYHKTTVDSGRPTDNPALESAAWFYKQFEAIALRNMRKGD